MVRSAVTEDFNGRSETSVHTGFWQNYLNVSGWIWIFRVCIVAMAYETAVHCPWALPLVSGILAVSLLCTKVKPSIEDEGALIGEDDKVAFIELSREGHPYGSDLGRLLFSDHWLRFQGSRCDFRLRPSDAIWMDESGQAQIKLANGVEVWFHSPQSCRVAEALAEWYRLAEDPAGEGVLPPTSRMEYEPSMPSALAVYTLGAIGSLSLALLYVAIQAIS